MRAASALARASAAAALMLDLADRREGDDEGAHSDRTSKSGGRPDLVEDDIVAQWWDATRNALGDATIFSLFCPHYI